MPQIQLPPGDYDYVHTANSVYSDLFTSTGRIGFTFESAGTIWIGIQGVRPGASTFVTKGNYGRIALGGPNSVVVDLGEGYAIDGWGTRHVVTNFTTVAVMGQNGSLVLGTGGNDRIDLHEFPAGGGRIVVDGKGGVNEASIFWASPEKFNVKVFPDGRSGVITYIGGKYPEKNWDSGFTYEIKNIDTLNFWHQTSGKADFSVPLRDFLTTSQSISVAATATEFTEGENVKLKVLTTGYVPQATLTYSLSGLEEADLGIARVGSITVDSDGIATIVIPTVKDSVLEDAKTLMVTVRNGDLTASVDVIVKDASKFSLFPDRATVDEGSTLSVLVGSSNVAAGTEVSYSITGISPFDVSGVKLTGSVKLYANGEALIKIPVAADGITEGLETLSLTLAGQVLAVAINDTSRAISADAIPPAPSAFAPADGAVGVGLGSNLAVTFNEPIMRGSGTVTLKTAAGSVVETFPATSNRVTVSGSTLTVDPTKNLDIYTRYVLDLGAGAVQDLAGNGSAATSQYDVRTETDDGLYRFFVVAFGAAPGVTYMGQLAEASNFGLSLQEIVEIFTTKSQFTSVYPSSLTNKELASRLVENIVKASATEVTKQNAAADIEAALGLGWSRGKVIYTVFGNLANKPLSDPTWGGTAKQFQNQLAVARYFTETLEGDSTSVGRLQAVLGNVNKDSDVSSSAKIEQLLNQPAYVVSADKSTVNEGAGIAFKVDSYGVAAGSAISYLLTGTNLTSADVVGGMLSGSVTLDSTGAGFITVQLAEDKTTEGAETLNLLLQGNPVKAVSILDTSITTTPINTDTTPPTLIGFNPMPGATNVAVGTSFIFTFSEAIKKGTGTIKLLDAKGGVVESFNVLTSSRLTWASNTLTIDPSSDLSINQLYRFEIPSGAIDDEAGNDYAGTSTYTITTVGEAGPPPGF